MTHGLYRWISTSTHQAHLSKGVCQSILFDTSHDTLAPHVRHFYRPKVLQQFSTRRARKDSFSRILPLTTGGGQLKIFRLLPAQGLWNYYLTFKSLCV